MTHCSLSRRRFLGSLATAAGAVALTAGCGAATAQVTAQSTAATGTTSAATVAASSAASSAATSSAAASSAVATSASSAAAASTASAATTSSTLAATTTAAASPTSSAAAAVKPGQVALNWWPGWPGTYMKDIATAFMKDNPSISVDTNLIYPDNDKLLTQLAAGTGPDVVSDIGYYNFIQRGTVLPIDDLLKTAKISTKDGDILAANWNAFFWHGKYYGVPAVDTAGREAIGYNVDLVQQAGLDPNNLPQTWDDLFVWHQKLTKVDSSGNVLSLGMDPLYSRANATSDGDTWLWPEMWGFHYFDVATMKYAIDRGETADFYTVIQKFYDLVGADKQATFMKPFTNKYGAFGAGKQAMAIVYPSGPAEVHQVSPNTTFKWNWVPMPTNRKGITLQTAAGHAQLLMQGTKHTEEGFKLALYMTGKQACDILFDQVGWVGPSRSWQKTMDLSKFPADVQQGIRFYTDSLDQAHEVWTPDMDPEDEFLGTTWRAIADQVNHHKIDAKTAAQQLQFKMTTQLNSQAGDFKAS